MKQLLILTLLLSTASHGAAIKKWVDEKGQVHYGDSPPVRAQIQDVRVSRPPSDPGKPLPRLKGQDAGQKDGDKNATQQQPPQAPQYSEEQKQQLCERAQKDMITLNTSDNIRLRSSDGKVSIMSDADKKSRKEQAQKDIDEFCN